MSSVGMDVLLAVVSCGHGGLVDMSKPLRDCVRIERYLSGDRTSARIEKGGSHFSSQQRIICPGEVLKLHACLIRLVIYFNLQERGARQIDHPPTYKV